MKIRDYGRKLLTEAINAAKPIMNFLIKLEIVCLMCNSERNERSITVNVALTLIVLAKQHREIAHNPVITALYIGIFGAMCQTNI